MQGANERDRWGYGGVIVYVNAWNNYDAYDLACPDCCTRGLRERCICTGERPSARIAARSITYTTERLSRRMVQKRHCCV